MLVEHVWELFPRIVVNNAKWNVMKWMGCPKHNIWITFIPRSHLWSCFNCTYLSDVTAQINNSWLLCCMKYRLVLLRIPSIMSITSLPLQWVVATINEKKLPWHWSISVVIFYDCYVLAKRPIYVLSFQYETNLPTYDNLSFHDMTTSSWWQQRQEQL